MVSPSAAETRQVLTAAGRVRAGQLTGEQRELLARLLETIAHVGIAGSPAVGLAYHDAVSVRLAYRHAVLALQSPVPCCRHRHAHPGRVEAHQVGST